MSERGTSTVFELEQRLRQLMLLQEAVRKINSTLDLDQLLTEIVADLADAFGCNRTCLLLLNEAGDELEIIALHGFDHVNKGDRFKRGKEGMVGHVSVTGEPMYAPDVRKNEFYFHCESSTLSEVAIPLLCKGRLVGVMDAQSPRVDGFSPEQLQLLTAFADSIASAIENARLFLAERLQKERALREQDEARVIQSALLPPSHPSLPGYSVEGQCLQVRAVGGDWYDYVPLDEHRVGIVLGDVCGKGMAAALLMSATRSIVRRNSATGIPPADVLRRVNASLRDDFPPGRFVTLIYAVLDAERHSLSFASAGHPPPMVHRSDDCSLVNTDSGLPLGICDSDYSESHIEMDRGTSVLLYTDGIVETTDAAGNEYGVGRLGSALRAVSPCVRTLTEDVIRYSGGQMLDDDATVVLIHRTTEGRD
ncbi:MAG TPA: GAF domain-containing SpoIIE family protein phosphatase [Verrucomicrobiae bacterium]|jgi:sigma-B regulation protein RsbU (phosphoserine phosphatase)|nr:GAF domain-containing SpoIIE family protein phosphatase [Verrucomicrobiae bacterium]